VSQGTSLGAKFVIPPVDGTFTGSLWLVFSGGGGGGGGLSTELCVEVCDSQFVVLIFVKACEKPFFPL
jgi:hypothetical protein